jgi:hypothetical protein
MNLNWTTIIRGLVILAACILALFLGGMVTSDSFIPLYVLGGLGLLLISTLLPGWLLLMCVVGSLLTGRSGLGVGYWELLAVALILRWLLYVPFRGELFGEIQGKWTFICICGFTLILFAHGVPAFLGIGESVGRRLAALAVASIGLSYLLLTGKLDTSKMPWLPWAGVIPGIVMASFDIINLAIPSALPITFFLYNDQNFEIVQQYMGANVALLRIAGLRELGLGIAFLCLSYFAHQRAFNLRLFGIQIGGTLLGAVITAIAGFRSFIAQIGVGVILSAYARSKGTLVAVCLCVLLGIGTLTTVHHQFFELPLTMQRALSWLPGDWDWRTKADAEGGFEWREQIRDYYFTRIFPDSWLLGRGLAYEERAQSMTWMMKDPRLNIEYFIMLQNYHSGLVSSLDYVGVLGTIFFIGGCLRAIWNAIQVLRARERSRPWHFWVAAMYLSASGPFWYTGFFDRAFPFFVMAMCLLEIARKEIEDNTAVESTGNKGAPSDYELEVR